MMNILYPKIRLAQLPVMFGYAVLGGILAGLYGIIHDQITYSISHEYYTNLKFAQFHYADFGLPPRIFVAEIGFLATWWVGFIAAWLLARITVPAFNRPAALRYTLHGFCIILTAALLACIVAYILGVLHGPDYSAWEPFEFTLRLSDLPSFVRVAYIHNASYLGGLIGLIIAIVYVCKLKSAKSLERSAGV